MTKDITGIITWLRGWFDDIYSAIGHSHRIATFTTPTFSSTYLNGTKHCYIHAVENIAVLDYYLPLQNIPTTDTTIISNIPNEYQAVGNNVQEIIIDTSGHRFLLTIDTSGHIMARAYSSSNSGGTVTGQIAYRCKGVTA